MDFLGYRLYPGRTRLIANILYDAQVEYEYERVCDGTSEPGRLRPDFSFVMPDGDLIIWEHLGMLNREDYRRGWEWKRQWYAKNGFVEDKNLFSSQEATGKGLDSEQLTTLAMKIKAMIA